MAKFFEWNDSYRIDDEIDDQHRGLIDMVNHLHKHLRDDKNMKLYLEVFLEQLVSYVNYHFASEEKAMKAANYLDFEKHVMAHNSLRIRVEEFRAKFMNNEAELSVSLVPFLKDWLVNHIGGMDKDFGDFLKARSHGHHTHHHFAENFKKGR